MNLKINNYIKVMKTFTLGIHENKNKVQLKFKGPIYYPLYILKVIFFVKYSYKEEKII